MKKQVKNNCKVCVVGMVKWNDKHLLLHKPKTNCWEFPGGKLDVGESLSQAVVREIKEETGLDVQVLNLSGIYCNNKADEFTSLHLLFQVVLENQATTPEVQLSNEHDNYLWLTFDELKKMVNETAPVLKEILQNKSIDEIHILQIGQL